MATLATRLAAVERRYPPPAPPLPRSPVALAAACGLMLDDWQHAALVSTLPRALWNCARQSGKSTVAALLALYVALTEPGALILLVAPAERQAAELLRKVQDLYGVLGHLVPAASETVLRLELQGGSRIVALPGREATIRGYSGVRLLIFDEASRVSDALYHACRPMLAVSGGRLLALSTPWGKRGWWHQTWTAERATLPDFIFRQEYEGSFEDTEQAVFRYQDIQAAVSADVAPLFGALGGAA
jgi:hypothetical protein